MRSKIFFILCFFILSFCFFVSSSKVHAQTDECLNVTEREQLVTCYSDVHFSNSIWDCSQYGPAGSTVTFSKECRDAFSAKINKKLDEFNWWIFSWLNGRSATYNQLMSIFDAKIAQRNDPQNSPQLTTTPTPTNAPTPTSTPFPTPTLISNSVYNNDPCINELNTNLANTSNANTCFGFIPTTLSCYNNLDAGNKLWNCEVSDGRQVSPEQCADTFAQYTVGQIKQTIVNASTNGQCKLDNGEPITAENVDQNYQQWVNNGSTLGIAVPVNALHDTFLNKNEDRNTLNITPTPGTIDSEIFDSTDRTSTDSAVISEAWNAFNCGFSNGAEDGKNACCTNTISDIDPDFSQDDSVIETNCSWFSQFIGGCGGRDFSKLAKDKLTNYLDDNQVTSKLNEFMQDEGQLPRCFVGTCDIDPNSETYNLCVPEKGAAICDRYIKDDPKAAAQCNSCMESNSGDIKKIYTALGCIDTSFEGVIAAIFTLGLGIAGMVALGCIIYAAFLMQTAQGNPEKIQKAQENITACITGLILIIFSVFILRVIGTDILRIPGFTSNSTTQDTTTICAEGLIQCEGTTICAATQSQCPQ